MKTSTFTAIRGTAFNLISGAAGHFLCNCIPYPPLRYGLQAINLAVTGLGFYQTAKATKELKAAEKQLEQIPEQPQVAAPTKDAKK